MKMSEIVWKNCQKLWSDIHRFVIDSLMIQMFSSLPPFLSVIYNCILSALKSIMLSSTLFCLILSTLVSDQKAKERGSREREGSGPTTKIAQLSRQLTMSGRQSIGRKLFWNGQCHDWWENLSSLGSTTTSWALIFWFGRARPLQESGWGLWWSLVLHQWPS